MKSTPSFAEHPMQVSRFRCYRGLRSKRARRLGLCWATGQSLRLKSKKDCGGSGFASSLNLLVGVSKVRGTLIGRNESNPRKDAAPKLHQNNTNKPAIGVEVKTTFKPYWVFTMNRPWLGIIPTRSGLLRPLSASTLRPA